MYRLGVDPEARAQIAALPDEAVPVFFEVLGVLELAPWSGQPQNEKNASAELRRWHFGPRSAGHVVYLIVEHLREVHVIMVQWLA